MDSQKDGRVRKDKDEDDADKSSKKKAARNQGMVDVSSPGASSSNQAVPPSAQPGVVGAGERTLNETWNEDEAPDKVQKILSICIGQGVSDKKGEVNAETYDEDLKATAEVSEA